MRLNRLSEGAAQHADSTGLALQAPCVAAIKACRASRAACLVATDTCNAGLLIPYTLSTMFQVASEQR